MTKQMKQWLTELREQDKQISRLMEEREKIKEEAKGLEIYEKLCDALYSDGESHWDF